MPVFDPAAIAGILADLSVSILSYAGIAALLYSIGGILIRTISWTFDKLLITFIGYFYKYFEMIINGTLLTDEVVQGMMNRVYLLVGVFVAFRLGMLLFNYILNPSEVLDEKVGVNALVKRVVLGLILIIFMPSIFNFAFRLQKAILDDQVIERVIMKEQDMRYVSKYKEKYGMGKIIGMTIFNGFFDLSNVGQSSAKVKKNFNKATSINETYDLSLIDELGIGLDSGILYKEKNEYVYDYFPIFSTVVLGYVLYLIIQYCLDAVVRSFKLSVLQVIAPICIVEYMINSDRNEVFKSWRKAVISTFAMLFMRVASIWFVAYVTMLMQDGMTDEASLLQNGDNLLKAIIVLGLLAFMMDFPKMMSDVFGLDLDQSGAVKNVMGKAMGAATAGLAIGGAAVGAMSRPAKALTKAGLTGVSNAGKSLGSSIASSKAGQFIGSKTKGAASFVGNKFSQAGNKISNSKFGRGMSAFGNKVSSAASTVKNSGVGRWASSTGQELKKAGSAGLTSAAGVAKQEHLGTALKTGATAFGAAVLASNAVTKSAAGGYQQTAGAIDSKIKGQEEKTAEMAYRQHQMDVADAQLEQQQNINIKLGVNENIDSVDVVSRAAGIKDFSSKDTVLGNLQNLNTTAEVTRDTVVNINDNVQTITNTTNTIAQNTNTIVNQNNHISHKIDQIEDNTFYSGINSINNMENSGYINKPAKNDDDEIL